MNRVCYCLIRFVSTFFLLCALFLLALLGGLFNRMRGGGIVPWDSFNETYWTAHLTGGALMAAPTAILVFVLGFNLRASIVVGLLTWSSLFIGWGSYMSLGLNARDFTSRLGIFDWILGRPEASWQYNYLRRFVRDYTGMSLRGLQWTLPAGYVLYLMGYGWQYSLCGSEMAAVYALGNYLGGVRVDSSFWSNNFFGTPPTAEVIWGTTVWYFLIVTCLVELVKRRRKTLDQRYRSIDIKLTNPCFQCCSSDCRGVTLLSLLYQVVVVMILALSLCSVPYYAAVEQADLPNQLQTFTGLLVGVVWLALFLGCSWGYCYGRLAGGKHRQRDSRSSDRRRRGREEGGGVGSDHAPRQHPPPPTAAGPFVSYRVPSSPFTAADTPPAQRRGRGRGRGRMGAGPGWYGAGPEQRIGAGGDSDSSVLHPPPPPLSLSSSETYPLLVPHSDSEEEKRDPRRGGRYGAMARRERDDEEEQQQEEEVTAFVGAGGNIQAVGIRRHILGLNHIPQHRLNTLRDRITILDYYWLLFETVFYLDVFAFLHFVNGLVVAMVTVLTIVSTFICLAWNINTPRFFVQPDLIVGN